MPARLVALAKPVGERRVVFSREEQRGEDQIWYAAGERLDGMLGGIGLDDLRVKPVLDDRRDFGRLPAVGFDERESAPCHVRVIHTTRTSAAIEKITRGAFSTL